MPNYKPIVLLTNDDGPPSSSSPNIFSFAKALQSKLDWEIRVVVPDCQKSWVGKAYAIGDIIKGKYFYPLEPDGLKGEITETRRPFKEGETMEWILLNGTPATCSNIGLYNLYPGEIDLVISGPNHGKNASSAFALSSGTIGAALAASLSSFPSIALSYGVVTRPVPQRAIELAHDVSIEIIARLWRHWGDDDGLRYHYRHETEVDCGGSDRAKGKMDMRGKVALYCVNVPLIEEKLEVGTRKVWWTRMWRNGYGQLFKQKELDNARDHLTTGTEKSSPAGVLPSTYKNASSSTPPSSEWSGPQSLPTPEATRPSSRNSPMQVHLKLAQADSKSREDGRTSDVQVQADVPIWEHARKEKEDKDGKAEEDQDGTMRYHFMPEMRPLVFPALEIMTPGSDMWAMHHGYVSVTPLQPSFAEPSKRSMALVHEQDQVDETMGGAHEFVL